MTYQETLKRIHGNFESIYPVIVYALEVTYPSKTNPDGDIALAQIHFKEFPVKEIVYKSNGYIQYFKYEKQAVENAHVIISELGIKGAF